MRTVRPLRELSIARTKTGFLSQWLHAGTGLGSKLENTSFLKSTFMARRAAVKHSTKYQSEQLFLSTRAELQSISAPRRWREAPTRWANVESRGRPRRRRNSAPPQAYAARGSVRTGPVKPSCHQRHSGSSPEEVGMKPGSATSRINSKRCVEMIEVVAIVLRVFCVAIFVAHAVDAYFAL